MQQGGPPYGVPPPEMAKFGSSVTEKLQLMAEAAAPISSRPPPVAPPTTSNVEELAAGNFTEEEVERGISGNRWPREETLALIQIRSDMDATFRDPGTLKGPLWDEVARKLSEQGYNRSAKKCKEKFENIHKYHKRTKDKCQDGKTYRFFNQLEALTHSSSSSGLPPPTPTLPSAAATAFGARMTSTAKTTTAQPTPISSVAPAPVPPPAGLGFLSEASSDESSSGSDGERKRKRGESDGGGDRRIRGFFKGLMKEVMERQEAMQRAFLEAIEKREQDRLIREEAWKRQEMARVTREQEAAVRDRAASASRDNAIITFLQNLTGQSIQLPQPVVVPTVVSQPTVNLPVVTPPPAQKQQQPAQQKIETSGPATMLVPVQESNQQVGFGLVGVDPMSSRWPKTEIDALIKLRSEMEHRYQEAGPKGPLWEDISVQMRRLGYNRSSKRCKEKWENINKYFKKVKESNKKRPDDAKTCPYFNQLDALYRNKVIGAQQEVERGPIDVRPVTTLPPPTQLPTPVEGDGRKNDDSGVSDPMQQVKSSNGGDTNKPEDTVKEAMDHNMEEEHKSDTITMDDGDDEDGDEEQQKRAYKIEFQRPNIATTATTTTASSDGRNQNNTTTTTASFMAMVQ